MIRYVIFLVILIGSQTAFCQPLKILFLGNGLLQANNNTMPQVFKKMATAGGREVEIGINAPDQSALSNHSGRFGDSTSIGKIESKKWDVIILQEQSYFPLIPEMNELFTKPALSDLLAIIRKQYPCSRVILLMPWAWPNGGEFCLFMGNLGWLCTTHFNDFSDMQQSLEVEYFKLAQLSGLEIAPVGTAWNKAKLAKPTIDLFQYQNVPNEVGTYISAAVLYATLFMESPVGNSFMSSLTYDQAIFLQKQAKETVLDDPAKWSINGFINQPIPFFKESIERNKVQFIDLSENGTKYFWDFGDGNRSNKAQPQHVFDEFGSYEVCQHISIGNECTQKFCKEITLHEFFNSYPNPFSDKLNVELLENFKGIVRIELHSSQGEKMLEKIIMDPLATNNVIDTSDIPPGVYVLTITNSGNEVIRKFVKN